MKNLSLIIFIALIVTCCKNDNELNQFSSQPDILRIADLQDRRSPDSLRSFITNEDPTIRKRTALAFASIQDTLFAKYVVALLVDKDLSVRKAAAFSLGQTRCRESEAALIDALQNEQDPTVRAEIIEAYGKVTRQWDLTLDTAGHASALAWSLYRAGLNGAVDSSKNVIAGRLLQNGIAQARVGAAHFFSRGGRKISSSYAAIARAARNDASAEVRMAATSALRKIPTDSTFQLLESIFNHDQDYRVRVNAIRAFQAFPFERSKNNFLKGLDDKEVSVAVAASEAILATIKEDFWIEVANKASATQNWRVQANLYDAVLRVTPNQELIREVKTAYAQSTNPYQKAGLLNALGNVPDNYKFLEQELMKADTPVVRVAAADALVAINRNKVFKAAWKNEFANMYQKAIELGDAGVIASVSQALADSALGYRTAIKDFSFLLDAKKKLSLPKDNEILQSLEGALAHFEKRKPAPVENAFNHPIDWSFVKTIPADQKVVVYTSKGKITMRMLVEEAPGSVANFLKLAKRGYFDKKFFHRVVPNFVIQGGCPRGDGTGGEDYSIRSEFSERRYKTGSVGMASAGKDTEGTQWFITHSPTPHLDGRYTIFAEVIDGMDVVHRTEVGDQILRVEILADRK